MPRVLSKEERGAALKAAAVFFIFAVAAQFPTEGSTASPGTRKAFTVGLLALGTASLVIALGGRSPI